MAHAIVMPSFGMFTVEGRLTSWLVPSGGRVEAGQPVLEIETDKAVQEVIAPASGILHAVVTLGAFVREEQRLGYVLAEGELPPQPEAPPDVDRLQSTEMRKPVSAPESPTRVVATPEARRLAAEHGIDLSHVPGTGPRGRIVAADVLARLHQS